jgi:tellurite resistance protein TehA-like permease
MIYDAQVMRWHDFYVTVGAASATLAGLLFVGLSLHLSIVVRHSDVRQLARVTLTNFLSVLLIALFMLIPSSSQWQTGAELITSAAGAMLFVARAVTAARKEWRLHEMRSSLLLTRFGLSAAGFAGQVVVGGLFVFGQTAFALGGLVAVVLVLLMVAVRNAWDLLVTVAVARGAAKPPPSVAA